MQYELTRMVNADGRVMQVSAEQIATLEANGWKQAPKAVHTTKAPDEKGTGDNQPGESTPLDGQELHWMDGNGKEAFAKFVSLDPTDADIALVQKEDTKNPTRVALSRLRPLSEDLPA